MSQLLEETARSLVQERSVEKSIITIMIITVSSEKNTVLMVTDVVQRDQKKKKNRCDVCRVSHIPQFTHSAVMS